MNHYSPSTSLLPSLLFTLRASTRVLLHHEFAKDPVVFALRHGVNLADDPFPETSFRKDPATSEKVATDKTNIHLVQHDAIRLFTETDGDGMWLQGFDINPSLLIHRDPNHPLGKDYLVASLSLLKAAVAPLLANPLDACHLVPGLVSHGKHITYWTGIDIEMNLPGVPLHCLHEVGHPLTGPAEGTTESLIRLGNRGDACVIKFETATCKIPGSGDIQGIPRVRVKVRLRGQLLPDLFGRPGNTARLNDIKRLVTFQASDVARVFHKDIMSGLDGIYLPVPSEWSGMGNPVTHAKVFALVSQLTSISVEELRAMDEILRKPSESTIERLDEDVPAAAACLSPIPLSSLFQFDSTHLSERTPQIDSVIDPLVAAAYGQGIFASTHPT